MNQEGTNQEGVDHSGAEVARAERRAELRISALFLLASASAVALAVVYWRGGQPQLEGRGRPGHRVPRGRARLRRRSGHSRPGRVGPPPACAGRESWSPQGLVAYSKICTYPGCPVGLYQAESHQLLCPCHQSTFDVLDRARPQMGPAAAPPPQLPIDIDADGLLVAQGDFSEPVGPSFWHRS